MYITFSSYCTLLLQSLCSCVFKAPSLLWLVDCLKHVGNVMPLAIIRFQLRGFMSSCKQYYMYGNYAMVVTSPFNVFFPRGKNKQTSKNSVSSMYKITFTTVLWGRAKAASRWTLCKSLTWWCSHRSNGRTTNEEFQASVFCWRFGVEFVCCNCRSLTCTKSCINILKAI